MQYNKKNIDSHNFASLQNEKDEKKQIVRIIYIF